MQSKAVIMKKLVTLTPTRAKWVAQRKKTILKGKPLNHNFAIGERYKQRLTKVIEHMQAVTMREVKALYKTDYAQNHFAMDASIASQTKILFNDLNKRFDKIFKDFAVKVSTQTIYQIDNQSKSSLTDSYKDLTGGMGINTDFSTSSLNETIKASINENVNLITSISEEYLKDVEGAVNRSITTGQGLKDLIPQIENIGGVTHRRAKNIALDQTRKAYNNINAIRMQSNGIKQFEWIHSHGGLHPRPLHQSYDGQIFSFDDLPIIDERTGEKGLPAQAVNCKCSFRPVIVFDD